MGNLLSVVVHCANTHDTKAGIQPAREAVKKYPSLQGFCADMGYRRTFVNQVTEQLGLRVEISERIKRVFEIQPKRWRVERTFAWFNGFRELSKDYAIRTQHEENMIWIAHVSTLLRRVVLL
ncbi:MAG: transposase [Lactococcus garvieae]